MSYADDVGERLRAIRTGLGLSLQDVERRSKGAWKAAVIGSYERGDRNISASRLCELADFYGVPASDVLPEEQPGTHVPPSRRRDTIVLDLSQVDRLRGRYPGVARFVEAIQVQRGDFNNRTLSVRGEDIRALAIIEDVRSEELLETLVLEGIATVPGGSGRN